MMERGIAPNPTIGSRNKRSAASAAGRSVITIATTVKETRSGANAHDASGPVGWSMKLPP